MVKRPLNVLITLMNGEHRIQVNGDPGDIDQLSRISGILLHRHRLDLISGPEKNCEIRACWVQSGNSVASQALSLLRRQACPDHLSQHPDCPYRDSSE